MINESQIKGDTHGQALRVGESLGSLRFCASGISKDLRKCREACQAVATDQHLQVKVWFATIKLEVGMGEAKSYVRRDDNGAWRVGDSRVSLDSVVIPFQQGHSAETIQQMYPALSLEDVYGAITYYLAHPDEVHEYLQRQGALWQRLRQEAEARPSPVIQRLRELQRKSTANQSAP